MGADLIRRVPTRPRADGETGWVVADAWPSGRKDKVNYRAEIDLVSGKIRGQNFKHRDTAYSWIGTVIIAESDATGQARLYQCPKNGFPVKIWQRLNETEAKEQSR